jgi:hypothetical protein
MKTKTTYSAMRLAAILLCATLFSAVLHAQASATARPSEPAKAVPCSAPEYRQFDFWIGDWDVFDVGSPAKVTARLRVTRILDGCVIREDYRDTNGHNGLSFNIYDAATKAWRQTWVTNRGKFLLLGGGMENGAMVLKGDDWTADGKQQIVKGIWKPINGGVQETAVISTDGGKTWTPWFDIVFHPHAHK